jgi:hypothetical protein
MNILTFPWLIAAPLAASPLVYLVGRMFSPALKLGRSAWLVRALSLLAMLAAWLFYIPLVQTFIVSQEARLFEVGAVLLSVDGLSLLAAGTALTLSTAVIVFSTWRAKTERKNTTPCCWP